jgi:uncharacterized BrkB/YihY/UPF0761 family membrane protein
MKLFEQGYNFVKRVVTEIASFSFENIFGLLHQTFPKIKWLHVSYYFFKDHCPMRSAALSFYTMTYMVSGLFLLIFLSNALELNFAEDVITYLIKLLLPTEIVPTTDYIIQFTKEILERRSVLIFASLIAIYNIMLLLTEIKENFDEILDHYYTKSSGTFIRNQFIKIFSVFGFIIIFHFLIQPIVNEVSQLTFGTIFTKYALTLAVLYTLFHHTSNRISKKLVLKGALLTTLFLFALEYLIFGVIANKHTFFGAESHQGGLGVIFLFPFWVYLAWNFVFIGLEYIATFTKQDLHKYPIEMETYIYISILEMLYNQDSIQVQYLTKRFNISYRFMQEHIIHRLKYQDVISYDARLDQMIPIRGWENKKMFRYFKLKHLLLNISDLKISQLLSQMDEEQLSQLTFSDYFELRKNKVISQTEEPTLWNRFKKMFSA